MVNAVGTGSCLRTGIERETFTVADRRRRQTGRLACLSALAPTPSSSVVPTGTLLRSRRPPATCRGAPTPVTCLTGWSSRPRCRSVLGAFHCRRRRAPCNAIWRELADRDERSQTRVAPLVAMDHLTATGDDRDRQHGQAEPARGSRPWTCRRPDGAAGCLSPRLGGEGRRAGGAVVGQCADDAGARVAVRPGRGEDDPARGPRW